MVIRKVLKKFRPVVDRILNIIGYKQSDLKIRSDAHRFWDDSSAKNFGVNSHWRGHGIFENDDERWLSIGQRHLTKFERMALLADTPPPKLCRILEWGCGGGANAIAFGKIASQFVVVDISQKSVEECLSQMKLHGLHHGVGILADIHCPESVATSLEPVDVVVCTYVFELLPTRKYALRLIRLFRDLLKPGGLAFIQLRYATSKMSTRGRNWGYRFGFSRMVTFFLDEFWHAASQNGFRPVCVDLLPIDDTVSEERYAYFLLEKPA